MFRQIAFSILERIDVGETIMRVECFEPVCVLSVSSNGSTWVKLGETAWDAELFIFPFSILERIDVGET